MADMDVLSVVALLQDLPEEGLVRGQVGTVVESWAPGVYEFEFSDENGGTYAMIALKAGQLMRLHHEPANQGASSTSRLLKKSLDHLEWHILPSVSC
jgi:hypothetical protein